MYVHAGNNRIIRTRDIIGIFDMDSATMTSSTRNFLKKAEKEGRMITVKEDIPKSFILTSDEDKIYISQISSSALAGRVDGEFGE